MRAPALPPAIRRANSADVPAIVEMLREMHGRHLAWDAARWTTDTPPHVRYADWIAELIVADASEGVVLVAEADGNPAGYLLLQVEPESSRHWSPRALYLHDIFVSHRHRRAGLARRLVNEALAWGKTHHPGLQFRLMTAAANEAARVFFAKIGFRPCVVEMIREDGNVIA